MVSQGPAQGGSHVVVRFDRKKARHGCSVLYPQAACLTGPKRHAGRKT